MILVLKLIRAIVTDAGGNISIVSYQVTFFMLLKKWATDLEIIKCLAFYC
jgi:hypothetical protein